jgi:cobalt-zinc-cadmium resistance protein CzcA
MLSRLLEFSVRQRVFVLLATLVLIGIGIFSALRLPIDAVPDITNIQVQVNTQVPALAPEEIETLVTFPIENEMAGIPGLVELRSLSKFGLSQVNLIFEDGTDLYRSRQLVSERLQTVIDELPPGLTPKLAPISTGLGEIFYYVVEYESGATNKPPAREAQLMELKLIHDYFIKPRLRSTPGLAEVNATGGHEKQIVIQPNPDKLKSVGMSFSEIADSVGENVENAGGSVIQLGGEQVTVRAAARVQTVEEIENLPLKFGSRATPLRVRDVADVGIGKAVRTGTATYKGEEAVLGSALMLAGENSRIVAKRVDAKLKEIQTKLPAGVRIIPVYDRTVLVDRTIRTVETSLFEGAILVVAVLLVMLGNWRAALIVALAIPLSLLFAMTGMVQGRVSGNLMSLGAIDFGLIIDGAVVMVENIIRHLAEKQHKLGRKLTATERAHEVLVSAKEVASPMFFGVVIITVVYFPILALTGIEGKMFKPMAITVIFALVGALALSLTLMPALCSWFLDIKPPPPQPSPLPLRGGERATIDAPRESVRAPNSPATGNDSPSPVGRERAGVRVDAADHGDTFVVRHAKKLYSPALNFSLRFRWLVTGAAVTLLALAAFVFSRLGAEFVPQLDEGSFATHMIRTTSIGIDSSVDMQKRGEKVLLTQFPEVDYVFSRLGTAEIASDPMGVNVADTYIMFKPLNQWRKENGKPIGKEKLAALMTEELGKHVPGEGHLFSQPIEMRFNEILEGTRADIAVKVFGEDFAVIEQIAGEAREILEGIRGAADVEFDALGKSPLLEIVPNREAMGKYNIHAAELNEVVHTALAGQEVGKLIEGNRRFDIVVRLSEDLREQIDDLKRLPVRVDDGGLLTLGQVADFEVVEQVAAIAREFSQRRAAIMVNLRGRDVESFVLEAQRKVALQIKLPDGYAIEFGGQFKNLQEARARLAVVVPVALGLIFVLVFIALGSLRQTLLVYTGIPLAVTGGVFALWLRDLPFSISAGVGFIALSGVAVLNGLMMISYFNLLRERGRDVAACVREGAMTRLRPVLTTALVASLGFVPMAIASGAGAEVQRPLATVVIGGILSSTFLTLVLLPTLYEWLERKTAATNSTSSQTST